MVRSRVSSTSSVTPSSCTCMTTSERWQEHPSLRRANENRRMLHLNLELDGPGDGACFEVDVDIQVQVRGFHLHIESTQSQPNHLVLHLPRCNRMPQLHINRTKSMVQCSNARRTHLLRVAVRRRICHAHVCSGGAVRPSTPFQNSIDSSLGRSCA